MRVVDSAPTHRLALTTVRHLELDADTLGLPCELLASDRLRPAVGGEGDHLFLNLGVGHHVLEEQNRRHQADRKAEGVCDADARALRCNAGAEHVGAQERVSNVSNG